MNENLRILTWNVLYRDVDARLPLLVPRVEAIRPDVFLVQETTAAHARALASATGMHLVAEGERTHPTAPTINAILAAEPPVRAASHTIDAGARCTYLTADWQVGSTLLRVGTTHLRHTHQAGRMGVDSGYRAVARGVDAAAIASDSIRESVSMRLAQLAEIRRLREEDAVDAEVLTGDLNFVPDGAEYGEIVSWGLNDAWRAAPRLGSGATIVERNDLIGDGRGVYRDLRDGAMPGAGGDLDYTLDYQFSRGAIDVGHAWIVGDVDAGESFPSDHLGIVVEYRIY